MFPTSPSESSGGKNAFIRHLVLSSLKQVDNLKLHQLI